MKKTIFTLLLAMATLHVAAQDTLRMPLTPPVNYYPQLSEWMLTDPMDCPFTIYKYSSYEWPILINGQEIDAPMRIVGLAGIFDTMMVIDTDPSDYDTSSATLEPEYMCLYQPWPDSLELKKMVQWNNTQPVHRIQLHALRISTLVWDYPGLYEVYFDDTVTVQDSFYVGFTIFNSDNGHAPTASYSIGATKPVNHLYYTFSRYRFTAFDSTWTVSGKGYGNWAVFPIIDTTGMFADTVQGGDTTIVDTTIVDTTSISPVADRFTYLLPNPATDHATVYSSFPIQNVAVFDPAGRCVLRRRVNDRTCHLDLTDYPKGIYLVTLTTPAGRTTKRLVVQ